MLCQRLLCVLRIPQLNNMRSISVLSTNYYSNSAEIVNGQNSLPEQRCNKLYIITRPGNGLSILGGRAYSSEEQPPAIIPIVLYDEIKDLPNHPEKLLVDVREPNELAETGRIPTSINIPLGEVQKAFSDETNSTTFLRTYGADKPNKNHIIIFSCRSGVRAEKAAEKTAHLGYTNVKNYKGSWLDWAEREGLPQ